MWSSQKHLNSLNITLDTLLQEGLQSLHLRMDFLFSRSFLPLCLGGNAEAVRKALALLFTVSNGQLIASDTFSANYRWKAMNKNQKRFVVGR